VTTLIAVAAVGVIAPAVVAALAIIGGLVVLTDWRGYGTKYYESPLGTSFYRNSKSFRLAVGGGYLFFGLVMAVIAATR